ncbi:MAG TPA: heterodisulfide reductase subunit C [Clostridiales bacterium]|nr:heterodisulfide reductase subunit C [Clostridiales bacterium]
MSTQTAPALVLKSGPEAKAFLAEVDAMAATQVEACYQCGKCSGGCPLSYAMDYQPRQIMRLVQMGLREEALRSRTIWICATCYTCTARCPRDIDIAGVMDALRVKALRRGLRPAERNVGVFHQVFLDYVRCLGRSYELGLMLVYKLRTLRLTEDLLLGLKMFKRGKLAVRPEASRGRDEVLAIFREAAAGDAGAAAGGATGGTGAEAAGPAGGTRSGEAKGGGAR